MKLFRFLLLAGIVVSCYAAFAIPSVVPAIAPEPVSSHEYFTRRAKLTERSSEKVAYLLKSADNAKASLYRQEANFFYLTGICKSPYFLLISPKGIEINGGTFTAVFFTGDTLFLQERAKFELQGETIVNMLHFNETMARVYPSLDTLYVSLPKISRHHTDWFNGEPLDLLQISTEKLHKDYPHLKVQPFDTIGSLRQVKSEAELANIRYAIAVTEEAIRQIWRVCTPGITENELQGVLAYHFAKYDVREYAFHPIVASGVNGLVPHYMDNNSATKDGEMMVLDMGARFQGYCADVTRTFPVSGKFTPEQREAYSALLSIQKKLIEAVRPGVRISELNRLSNQLIEEAGYIKYRLHAMCHHLGIEPHDFYSDEILRPGHVITVEPGIYFPADATELPAGFRGMGIRIEDDVLVTENGYEVLSKNIPKEIDEIEAAMRKQ